MLDISIFKSVFKVGSLTVILPDNQRFSFGNSDSEPIIIKLHDKKTGRELFFNPALALGELYMDGRLTIEKGDIYTFLMLCMRNIKYLRGNFLYRTLNKIESSLKIIHTYNRISASRRNVAHHYNLSYSLYRFFLDEDLQYSCAYFRRPELTLEEAQQEKKKHIAKKLLLNKPGLKILDIGSGWGGMGLFLAENFQADVKGITLSSEQLKISRERSEQSTASIKPQFYLEDYRQTSGSYDRIVSVGMFEHVGLRNYRTFFRRIRELLREDGVCVLHSIGTMGPPGPTNPWLRKYIFPGGYTPSLSEVTAALEKEDLWITDIEIWRLHYAETLKEWRRRFLAHWDEAKAMYDERFCRMWEFYLAACEVSFRELEQMVFQMQITRKRGSVPLTRDYLCRD